MADVYEIATPGPFRHIGQGVIVATVNGQECQVACVTGQASMHDPRMIDAHEIRNATADLLVEAANSYRALLAQKAVVEAAVEQERQRWLADESRAARQDLETQAQHTEDYRSACRATNAAVRAMKEQTR